MVEVVFWDCWTYNRQYDSTRILDTNAEGFEDFDLGIVSVATVRQVSLYRSIPGTRIFCLLTDL